MKRALRRLLDRLGGWVTAGQVRWLVRRAGDRPITVLDIDNTLADAWPSFGEAWPSHRARLAGLQVLPGMRAAAHDPALGRGDLLVFLSHRNWWEWALTRSWLRREGFAVGVANLVLVARPADKVAHLRALTAGGRRVTCWDDLSHGRERDELGRYDDVADACLGLGIELHTLDEIEAVVAAAGGRAPVAGPSRTPPN